MRGVTLLFLLACSGDKADDSAPVVTDDSATDSHGDSEGDTAPDGLDVHLSGAAAKGPMIRGSSVNVIALDAAGAPTGEVFSTFTEDDAGSFSLDISLDGPAQLEADGYYYNEATGALSTAPITLRSYHTFTEDGETSAYINLFTHLCAARVETLLAEGQPLSEAIATAESEALVALTIAPPTFDPGVEGGAMNLLGGDSDGNAWLFGLSVVLTQRALDEVGPDGPLDATLSETINSLSDDLADGVLDGDTVVPTSAELYALQATIDADAAMALLATRFVDIGSSAEVPDLHRVFDHDLDATVDLDDPDADGDGFDRPADGGADCDDYDATVYPGAPEDPTDGVESDCTTDRDGDGSLSAEDGGADCDDDDAESWPGAEETWYDGVDQACDGDNDGDQDGDGHDAEAMGGDDCDDTEANVSPSAAESCATAVDDDCDGDDNDVGATGCATWYLDVDIDGFGRATSQCTCEATGLYTASVASDCDDTDGEISPAEPEACNDVDDDCDGAIDESGASGESTWYLDSDGDGDGDPASTALGCDAPAGYVAGDEDCDDTDGAVHPGATETCATTADDDCDGDDNEVGAAACTSWYLDQDGDGYGVGAGRCACESAGSYTAPTGDDCDDNDDTVSPAGWPCTEELTTGDAMAKFTGASSGGMAGQFLWMGDDYDLDGNPDVVVSAYYQDSGKGAVYVDFGPASGTSALSAADLSFSDSAYSFVGYWVGASGDLNGDGFEDLGFLASKGGFFAYTTPVATTATLASPDVLLSAEVSTDYLSSAAGAFDFDGDGQDDLAVGDANWSSSTGAAYVLYGPFTGTDALASSDLILRGEATTDSAGGALGRAGDTDGDGLDDLIVGATYNGDAGAYAGAAYLVLGGTTGATSLADADAIVTGTGASEWVGDAVAGQGDTDGDGYGDVVIGASRNGTNYQGAAWLMSGPLTGTMSTAAATATAKGGIAQDYIGGTLGELHDLDGDAVGDLTIGALNDFSCGKKTGTGSVHIYYGPVSGSLSCAHADVVIAGATVGGRMSRGLASVGDTDGDGLGELFVGASHESTGSAYVFSGTVF